MLQIDDSIQGSKIPSYNAGVSGGFLTEVKVDANYFSKAELKKADEATRIPNASITFVLDNKKVGVEQRQHSETFYGITNFDLTNPKHRTAFNIQAAKFKHIVEAYLGTFPPMKSCKDYAEFYTEIAKMLNEIENRDSKKVAFILTYDNENRLHFGNINFIEKLTDGIPTSLKVAEGTHKLKPSVANIPTPGGASANNADFGDFPADLPPGEDAPF